MQETPQSCGITFLALFTHPTLLLFLYQFPIYTHTPCLLVNEVDLIKKMKQHTLRDLVRRRPEKIPIVLIPGFMSTRMAAWQNKPCFGLDVNVLDQVCCSQRVNVVGEDCSYARGAKQGNASLHDLCLPQLWFSMEKMMQTLVVDRSCWLQCLALATNQV